MSSSFRNTTPREVNKQNFAKAKKGIFIGVGGSFDVLSGTKKRAPNSL